MAHLLRAGSRRVWSGSTCSELGTQTEGGIRAPSALIYMAVSEPTDQVAAFTEEILRAGSIDSHDLARATELLATARDRVLEHLRLAVELRQRMESAGEDGATRTYG